MMHPLEALVARRWWSYGGALALVLAARTLVAPSVGRALGVSVAVGVMVVTYAGERWVDAERPAIRPLLVAVGAVGVVAGLWLTLTGRTPGLVFLAGGLLFLGRGVRGGDAS